MIMSLEIPELPTTEKCSEVEQKVENNDHFGDSTEIVETKNTEAVAEDETQPLQGEVIENDLIEAYKRKEQALRDAQSKARAVEDEAIEYRRLASDYKKRYVELRNNVDVLINCDISGFIAWEKEQNNTLFRKQEQAENAWRNLPVENLDLPEKDKEKISEHFFTCGAFADWLNLDFPPKKKGITEKVREKGIDAINKISGVSDDN